MRAVVLFAFLVVAAQASPRIPRHVRPRVLTKDPIEGAPKYTPSKIVSGTEATRGQFPYQVALYMDASWFCGGSILSETIVLTAGHCPQGANSIVLLVGAHDVSDIGEGHWITESSDYTVHEGFDGVNIPNDIAVIRLADALTFNEYTNKITIAGRSMVGQTFEGQTVRVSGWGRTSDTASGISNVLNYVDLTVISNSECQQTYGSDLIDSIMCTSGSGTKNTCNGDSGGPLVIGEGGTTSTQVGVVSFVSGAGCESGDPSGFSRITEFLDWLEANTGLTFP